MRPLIHIASTVLVTALAIVAHALRPKPSPPMVVADWGTDPDVDAWPLEALRGVQ